MIARPTPESADAGTLARCVYVRAVPVFVGAVVDRVATPFAPIARMTSRSPFATVIDAFCVVAVELHDEAPDDAIVGMVRARSSG
jgi:hypothetical protein